MAPMQAGNDADESWAQPSTEAELWDEAWKELLCRDCDFLHRAPKGSPGDEGSLKAPGHSLLE